MLRSVNVPTRLALFAAVLAAMVGLGAAVGAAVGPIETGDTHAPAPMTHEDRHP